jgi:putative transposase
VLLKIVYLLTCRVLGVAVLAFRGDRAKAAELLALRHENAVLRRHVSWIRYDLRCPRHAVGVRNAVPGDRWPPSASCHAADGPWSVIVMV